MGYDALEGDGGNLLNQPDASPDASGGDGNVPLPGDASAVVCQQGTSVFVVGDGGISAGSLLMLHMMADGTGDVSASDEAGNVYSPRGSISVVNGISTNFVQGQIVNALAPGDRITLDHPGRFNYSASFVTFPNTDLSTGLGISVSNSSVIKTTVSHEGSGFVYCSLSLSSEFPATPDPSSTLAIEQGEDCGKSGFHALHYAFWKEVPGAGQSECTATIDGGAAQWALRYGFLPVVTGL